MPFFRRERVGRADVVLQQRPRPRVNCLDRKGQAAVGDLDLRATEYRCRFDPEQRLVLEVRRPVDVAHPITLHQQVLQRADPDDRAERMTTQRERWCIIYYIFQNIVFS